VSRIVDAQLHVGPFNGVPRGQSNFSADPSQAYPVLTGEQAEQEMTRAGVDAAVLMPVSARHGGSNSYVIDVAQRAPGRFCAMAVPNPLDRSETERLIDFWSAEVPAVRGIRLGFLYEPLRSVFRSAELEWLWALLSRKGLPLAVHAEGNLDVVDRIGREFPELRIAVDHCGLRGNNTGADLHERLAPLMKLARLGNVSTKLSAFTLQTHEAYPYRDLHRPVADIVAAFGSDRVFWGSDLSRLTTPYADEVSYVEQALTGYSKTEVANVMGDALCEWLNWRIE
jgi:L-fuconolactonase